MHILGLVSPPPPENRAIYEVWRKHTVEPDEP